RRHTRSKRDWSSDVCSSDLQLRSRPVMVQPSTMLNTRAEEIELILARSRATLGHLLHRATDHIDQLKARVRSLSPQHTLNRGYAVVHHNNTMLRDTAEVDVGDNLDILVAAGRLGATTTSVAETTQE